ncbi:uncharacterized protein [Apostichopus japonicus]
MSRRKGDLSENLLRWSTDEMGFRAHGQKRPPLTAEDLKEICRGNMADIWEYVIEHVRNHETVHKIKGNLKLHQLQQRPSYKVKYQQGSKAASKTDALMKKRNDLKAKLNGMRRDVDHLEKDMERLKRDLQTTDDQYKETLAGIQETQHKKTLLQAYLDQCRIKQATYNEFQKSLKNKRQQFTDLANKSSQEMLLFSKERLDSCGNQEDVLETACTKQVREVCKCIQHYFLDVLQNKSTDQEAIKEKNGELWERIEETVQSNSAEEIIKSLMIITNETAAQLNQRTNQINIKQDVERLRFKFESGQGYVDISPGRSELKSVQQLITEKQLVHIQRFMEGEKNRTLTAKMNNQLNHMVMQMEQKFNERFTNCPGELELAKTLFQAELNLVATSAAVKMLKVQQENLQEQAAVSKEEQEALFDKYRQIQDFQKLTDRKQSLIQVLITENLNSRKQLEETRRNIGSYIQKAVCEHEAGTVAMATSLKDSSSVEISAFHDLSLEMLHQTQLASGELKPTNQLSISRFNSTSPALGGDALMRIQTALHFPPYLASEKLLPHVVKMKCEVDDIRGVLRSHDYLQGTLTSFHDKDVDIIQHTKELCEQVRDKDAKQNEQLGPVLQARLTEGAEAINVCMKTRSDLTAWWDQPAQHLTPWVKVDDLSYSQWLDKWIMGVSQMKEIADNAEK